VVSQTPNKFPAQNKKMSLKKEIKYFLLLKLLPPVIYIFLKVYTGTLELKVENADAVLDHVKRGGRFIMASWHQRFFGGFFLPKALRMRPCIMISRSRDGDFIADVVRRIGWEIVRGSGSRGGKEALREMVAGVLETKIGGHIVDGPTGPPRIVKAGIIALAQKTGAAITPTCVSYENPWIFNSWDRFMIPKPFSGVLLRFGPLQHVPAEMNDQEFEDCRIGVEQQVGRVYEEVDRYWAERRKPRTGYSCIPVE